MSYRLVPGMGAAYVARRRLLRLVSTAVPVRSNTCCMQAGDASLPKDGERTIGEADVVGRRLESAEYVHEAPLHCNFVFRVLSERCVWYLCLSFCVYWKYRQHCHRELKSVCACVAAFLPESVRAQEFVWERDCKVERG